MKRMSGTVLAAGLLAAAHVDVPSTLSLTPEERTWISQHPVIRVVVDPKWKPVQYIENGVYKGLASEYLAAISRRTGLRFKWIAEEHYSLVASRLQKGEADMLPVVQRRFAPPEIARFITFSVPYHAGTTLAITRDHAPVIFELARLIGKPVAVRVGGAYHSRLLTMCTGVHVLGVPTTEAALLAVAEGKAEAALDADVALIPYLRRRYDGVLHVSGAISTLPVELSMGIRNDLPVLRSVIEKALASLTAAETDEMDKRWLEQTDYGAPSWPVLIRYYRLEIILSLLALLTIIGFAAHAQRQRHWAVQSEKEKSLFLAVMGHEIRSPMHAILASMELLRRSTLPAKSRRLIDSAMRGADNLLRLLDDVLDLSKLEAGRLELALTPCDVLQSVREVTDLLEVQAREKGISLTVDTLTPLAWQLELDGPRVGQIVQNLISNAIKFTSQGEVRVLLWTDPMPHYAGAEVRLYIRVIDAGIGMDAAQMRRLFHPYAQGSPSTWRRFGGTGLGLSICRQLVNLMRGSIDVQSEPGGGTTITVGLPCKASAPIEIKTSSLTIAQEVTSDACQPATAHAMLRILLVEDAPANQLVMQAQLAELGCKVSVAADGPTALQELEQSAYDLVLLDCDLPLIDGYTVARQWRKREAQRGQTPIPILAVSGYTDVKHTAACLDAGMDAVLRKPIRLSTLGDALRLWCDADIAAPKAAPVSMGSTEPVQALAADITALRAARMARDMRAVMHYLHRLSGAAAVVGADVLARRVKALETDKTAGGNSPVPLAEQDLDELDALLKAWAAQRPGTGLRSR